MNKLVAALSWLAPIALGAAAYHLGGAWAAVGGAITGLAFFIWANDYEVRELDRKGILPTRR